MKYDLYSFKDGEVNLEFKFIQNESSLESKIKFLKLLQKAVVQLSSEVAMANLTGQTNESVLPKDENNKDSSPFRPKK